MRKTEFFVILDHFLPFYLLNNPKNQNIEKMKKLLEDIIILHMCNINYNHMMYGSWDTEHDRENFLSFWTIFCTFSLLTHPKNKKFEKMKQKPRDMIILHMCTIDDSHMMYGSWDMECNRHNFLSFWTVFCPFTPLTTQKNKILTKMEKPPRDIIILHKCTINGNQWCIVPEIWSVTDRIFYFGLVFALLPKKIKFWKTEKNI